VAVTSIVLLVMEEEDDEDVGSKLDRIRAAQAAKAVAEDDDDEESDDDLQAQQVSYSQPHPALTTIGYRSPSVPMPPLYYRNDQTSPWAPAGLMNRPPIAPSTARAPTPTSCQPSRSSSPVTKKKKAKRNPQEEEKLQADINMVINNFRADYKHKIICEEERDTKNVDDKELYNVARWLPVNKPVLRRLDLATFNSKQIRRLALSCGVKGGGNLTLFQCRRKIAVSITMGTVYNDKTIANPSTTAAERKVNTLMWIANACFHSDMKDKFIDLNDAKKRADYEAAHGGNPVKDFWVQISDFTNDTTRNDVLGVVLDSRAGEDEHLIEFVAEDEFNLNDFTSQTYISCQQHMSDCMKARENCLKQMQLSGHHSNDLWTYCGNAKFTKLRQSSAPVPAKAIYYCHVLCSKNPDIDGKFATFLSDKLKSDSEVDLTGSADQPEEGGKLKTNKGLDTLVQSIASATTDLSSYLAEKKQLLLSTIDDESRKRTLWAEYLDLAGKFLAMKSEPCMLPLLCNFAIRVRELEKLCGVPSGQSITLSVPGIPVEVFATVGSNPSTSDITSNK